MRARSDAARIDEIKSPRKSRGGVHSQRSTSALVMPNYAVRWCRAPTADGWGDAGVEGQPHCSARSMSDDEDDAHLLVIDAGSFKWSIGFAGDDTPLAVWGLHVPLVRTEAAIRQRRESMWAHLRSWVRTFHQPVGRLSACFTVSVFDDADGDEVTEIAERCFGGDEPLFSSLWLMPQEHVSLYGNGRSVGLVVNLGFAHITTYALYEGYEIGQMARRVRWRPQLHAADTTDASEFIESTKLAEVVADALCDAPMDCFAGLVRNIVLSGGFAGGSHGVSFGGRPPPGVPSPPEWQPRAHTEAEPPRLAQSWLKDAIPPAVNKILQARGRGQFGNLVARDWCRVVSPPCAPQTAWVGGSIVASLSSARSRRLTRAAWLQSKADGRRAVERPRTAGEHADSVAVSNGWMAGREQVHVVVDEAVRQRAVEAGRQQMDEDASSTPLWARALVPADSSAVLAAQEEAARLVACAPSLVVYLPPEVLALIEWQLTVEIRSRGLRGRPPLDETKSLVRASAAARAAAHEARADIESGKSRPLGVEPPSLGFGSPSSTLEEQMHHRVVIVPTAVGDARNTFALRVGATVADLVAAIARRRPSKSSAVSTIRLVYSGLELTALHPSTRLDRVGRGGSGGVALRDGAEVWRYEDGGQGGARLAAAVAARGVATVDAMEEESWAMRTWMCIRAITNPPGADENERAEPVEDSKDAVADCEPLCRLRMHRCIDMCQDTCYPMRKEQMVDYATYTALGMDDGTSSKTPSPAIAAAFDAKARRGRKALEYDKSLGAWARDEVVAESIVQPIVGGPLERRIRDMKLKEQRVDVS